MTDATTRPFGFWTATALVVGGMIGTGIFMIPSALAPFGWTGVIAWGISIVGALAIAWPLGRLSAAMPEETGAIAVTGKVLGPLAAVLIGWSYWISVWTAVASIAVGATSYLAVLLPVLNATPLTGAVTSVVLIWLLTLLNLGGPKGAGQFQVATTLLKLLPLIAVVVILAWLASFAKTPLPALPSLPDHRALAGSLSMAVTLTLFPLVGFETASVVAERVRDPARNVVRATLWGTAITGLLYVVVCTGIVFTLTPGAVAASSAPFSLFVETFWGRGAAVTIAAFAAISAIGALNCWVLVQGEVVLGMARASLLPHWFARVSVRDVPVRVQILSSSVASIMVLSTASRSLGGVFQFASLMTTCTALILYLAVCVAALLRRITPVIATIGLLFSLWALWGSGLEALGWSIALTLTGLPLYWLRPRQSSEARLPEVVAA